MGTVLVVDDERLVVSLVQRLLDDDGYESFCCVGGAAALNFIMNHPARIEILLTDIKMPDVDGLQVAKAVRRRWPDARIIFMSGYCGDVDMAGSLDGGAHFLAKPFTRGQLLAALTPPTPRTILPPAR